MYCTNFAEKRRSLGRYNSRLRTETTEFVFLFVFSIKLRRDDPQGQGLSLSDEQQLCDTVQNDNNNNNNVSQERIPYLDCGVAADTCHVECRVSLQLFEQGQKPTGSHKQTSECIK
jgi:hypothetical protein